MKTETDEQIMSFSTIVEEIVYMKDVSYMEAIIIYCEENNVEVEVAASLINANLKYLIQLEAETLNFLPKSNTTKLPI